jgi:hypothetical protein
MIHSISSSVFKIILLFFIKHQKADKDRPSVRLCVTLPLRLLNDALKPCTCSAGTVTEYQKRISGPLLDRIDIHIEVPRVEAARERQRQRFA